MKANHWRTIVALLLMPLAFYADWVEFYFAILFLFWSIKGIKDGNIFFLEDIDRKSSPVLYWIVVSVWFVLSLLSLAYSEPVMKYLY